MKSCFLSLFVILSYTVQAQGKVVVIADPRIEKLVALEGEVIPPATSPQMVGYRIQLFFDDNKEKVDQARSQFINKNPKVDTYVSFMAPNYFLKVGDFRSQMEAEKIKATVEGLFPTSFIVREMVNLPRIDQ